MYAERSSYAGTFDQFRSQYRHPIITVLTSQIDKDCRQTCFRDIVKIPDEQSDFPVIDFI